MQEFTSFRRLHAPQGYCRSHRSLDSLQGLQLRGFRGRRVRDLTAWLEGVSAVGDEGILSALSRADELF